MKQCSKQSVKIVRLTLNQKEMSDDVTFLDEELMEGKIENYNLKVKLAKSHNTNKAQVMENLTARDELEELVKVNESLMMESALIKGG